MSYLTHSCLDKMPLALLTWLASLFKRFQHLRRIQKRDQARVPTQFLMSLIQNLIGAPSQGSCHTGATLGSPMEGGAEKAGYNSK